MVKKISIVILNYNDFDNTIKLIEIIDKYRSIDEIVVVDNKSTDNSIEEIRKYTSKRIHLINSDFNGGYGHGNNLGVKYSLEKLGCDYSLIVNPDVRFSELCLKNLVNCIKANEECAVVSCVQKNLHLKNVKSVWKLPKSFISYVLSTSIIFSKLIDNSYRNLDVKSPSEVGCVQGAMLLVDSKKFMEIGGYDEDVFLYGEEIALGFAVKKRGYKTIYLPTEYYEHFHSQSINKSIPSIISKRKMMQESKRIIISKNWKINYIHKIFIEAIFKLNIVELKLKGILDREQ